MPPRLRVTAISDMLQPYRIPVFNALADRDDIEFTLCLLSLKEANRKWEVSTESCRFNYQVLPSRDLYIRALDWGLHFNTGVRKALVDSRPDVIVGTGYVSPAYLVAQQTARSLRKPYVLWSGSTLESSRMNKGLIRFLKTWFIRRSNACLTYGSRATTALIALGGDPSRIITGCNTVDIDYYATLTREAADAPGYAEWRGQYPERLVLYIGQMIDRKGVLDLLEAYRRAGCDNLGLILIGDGPELETYKEASRDLPGVFWESYVLSRHIGPFLAAADALVMPSRREVWGLVANEAMAAGVPVIGTTVSGSVTDLVRDGVTGYAYEAGNIDQLRDLLVSVAREKEAWTAMGQNAALRIQEASPANYADALVRTCHLARG